MGMPKNLVLVRHGQSEANVIQARIKEDPAYIPPEGFYDRHDSEMRLSQKGVDQADRAGEMLDSMFPNGFDRYYVSALIRTIETAGALAICSQEDWRIDDRWRERDWGEYGVLNEEQREVQYELSHKLRGQNKWYWSPPGGESLASGVRLRFETILRTLHNETEEKDVIAVTHGEMIDVARFVLERMTPFEWNIQDQDPDYKVSNCQIVHYTRINPETGSVADSLKWRRSICPWDNSKSWNEGEWVDIEHKCYSDDTLLKIANTVPRLL